MTCVLSMAYSLSFHAVPYNCQLTLIGDRQRQIRELAARLNGIINGGNH